MKRTCEVIVRAIHGSPRLSVAAALLFTVVAFPPSALCQTPARRAGTQAGPTPGTTPDIIRRREEWFYKQRAYPRQHIPAGARLRALRQKEALENQILTNPPSPPAGATPAFSTAMGNATLSSTRWTLIGPQPTSTPYPDNPVSGRVTALAVDPTNPDVVYLGSAEGGVWKTTDGGSTWAPLTDNQPSLAVGSIAVDPSNPSTIYVGTGEENFNGDAYFGAGVLKSTDGGSHWTQIAGPFVGPLGSGGDLGGAYIGSIAVSPSNSQLVLAAANFQGAPGANAASGVYRSTDGGNTWTFVESGAAATQVLFDPSNSSIAYASFYGAGVYESKNAGQAWGPINGAGSNVLNLTNAGRVALAIDPNSTCTQNTVTQSCRLYAGVGKSDPGYADNGTFLGLFTTTNGGANWTQLTSGPDYCSPTGGNPQCNYDNVVAVDPKYSYVFVGGSAERASPTSPWLAVVESSPPGGASWTDINVGPDNAGPQALHADVHAIAFAADGSKMYVGTDGGVWSTPNITSTPVTWTNLNARLALTQFYPGMSMLPYDTDFSLGGAQDNGVQFFSGSPTWQEVVGGDGGWTALDPVSGTAYVEIDYAPPNTGGVNVFVNSGQGWFQASNGIDGTDRGLFIPPLVMDPSKPQTLYFGTYRVYQTTDGRDWAFISADLTGGSGVLTTIAAAPSDSKYVYAGSSNAHVSVTTTATTGASGGWSDITGTLPNRYVTQIAVDPKTPTTAYVTFSGFSYGTDTVGHVFETTTGTNWTDISGNLPNIPVNDIVVDPDVANTLYVATDIGVFQTTDGGTTWTPMDVCTTVAPAGCLPNVAVLSLKLNEASRILRAGTHGRSAWDLLVPANLPVASFSTPTVDFGQVPINTTSASQTVTLTNSGTSPMTVTGVSVAGSTDFTETNNCPATLAASANCTITLAFTPTLDAAESATLRVADNAPANPQLVYLSGTGTTSATYPLAPIVKGQGTVTSTDGKINCTNGTTGTCSATYPSGTTVTMNATAASGWTFSAWSSAAYATCNGGNPCVVVMNQNLSPTATFTANVSPGSALRFIPIKPCRIADTRNTPDGPFSGPSIAAGTSRDFVIPNSSCGIPSTAAAYALNVTVVPQGPLGYLTLWPSGQAQPYVSTLNSDGRIKANAAIIPAGTNGAISAFATNATDLVLDINGYFVPATNSSALQFYPLTPCRVADTRKADGPLGGPFMPGGQGRTFPILSSSCGVPSGAQAYSLNLTAVPRGPLGYLTAWPTGQTQPFVSTLNAPTGTITANAAMLAAGASGQIDMFTTNDTDLVIDTNGYFAAPGAAGLSLYTLSPCRVLDTRNPPGAPPFSGQKDVNVTASGCGTPSTALAFVFNATVVPEGPLGYLTLWPQGEAQPLVSTLNAVDGAITGNMAIVPTNNGSISAWATDPTHLVLDIFGYLGP